MPNRRQPDLPRQAREFAAELSTTLNGTVTDGLRLSVVMDPRGRAVIGNRLSNEQPAGAPIALTVSASPPKLSLEVVHTLALDDRSSRFLTTTRSTYSLTESGASSSIVTYDYTRDPPNEYPGAHLHLHGESQALRSLLSLADRARDRTSDLHFPVGGDRYRPCLEDLIEFCVLERLVEPRDGWQGVLAESRGRFRENQLRAAVRRAPQVAAAVLRDQGFEVSGPAE